VINKDQTRILKLIKACHNKANSLVLPFGENQELKKDLAVLHSLFLGMIHQKLLKEQEEEERYLSNCSPYTDEQIKKWAKADKAQITKTINKHRM
jgi:hypothetical protein